MSTENHLLQEALHIQKITEHMPNIGCLLAKHSKHRETSGDSLFCFFQVVMTMVLRRKSNYIQLLTTTSISVVDESNILAKVP